MGLTVPAPPLPSLPRQGKNFFSTTGDIYNPLAKRIKYLYLLTTCCVAEGRGIGRSGNNKQYLAKRLKMVQGIG